MITFTILLIAAVIMAIFTIFALLAGGGIFVVVFGDLAVCVFMVVWIIRRILGK
jgi:hypothetical protein